MAYIEQILGAWSATIQLASALILLAGVIIVSILGIKSMKKAGSIQQIESRRHVLDEINKWAMDVGVCVHKYGDLLDESNLRTIREAHSYLASQYDEMQADFMELALRSEYIKELAKTQILLKKPLNDSVDKLRRVLILLHHYIENIEKIEQKNGVEKAMANVAKTENNLYDCILDLTRRVGSTEAVM